MTTNLKTLIQNGESITTEFKESKSKLNKFKTYTIVTEITYTRNFNIRSFHYAK